jgi:hypothetical protein
MQEWHVRGAYECSRSYAGDSGQSGGDAAHRAQSLDRIFDNLHAHGQGGQLLARRGNDNDRTVNGSGQERGGAVQERGAVPFERCFGRAHSRRSAAGQHHSRGICDALMHIDEASGILEIATSAVL